MLVPDKVRKNILFVGVEENGRFVPKATAFIVSVDLGGRRFDHFVTAEHVISGLKSKGYEQLLMRLNLKSGGATVFPSGYEYWRFHPGPEHTDVAVSPANLDREIYDFTHTRMTNLATEAVVRDRHVGVGDEVFICGLFRQHAGRQQNVPIVRTGNIAAMPLEPVATKYCGDIDAYLIEARSIGGLSGSPVFVHFPPFRVVENVVTMIEEGDASFNLLGLMHGHFDVQNMTEDVVNDDVEGGGINSGIGVVVPAQKIFETIMQPELVAMREAIIEKIKKDQAATPDLGVAEPAELVAEPGHRERFNALVNAAARKKPQGG